jgi:hypothetical protein
VGALTERLTAAIGLTADHVTDRLGLTADVIAGLAQCRKQQAAAQQRDAREQDHQKAAGNPINGTHNATPSLEAVSLRIS